MTDKNTYTELTEEMLEDFLLDLTKRMETNKKHKIHAYTDKEGKILYEIQLAKTLLNASGEECLLLRAKLEDELEDGVYKIG